MKIDRTEGNCTENGAKLKIGNHKEKLFHNVREYLICLM